VGYFGKPDGLRLMVQKELSLGLRALKKRKSMQMSRESKPSGIEGLGYLNAKVES
jgi:hypothetical protein